MSALATFRLPDEFTIQNAAEFKVIILTAVSETEQVVIELDDVLELDTAGLQVLLLAIREAQLLEHTVTVTGASSALIELLTIIGLDAVLNELVASGDPR